jgi:hypothetical protein
MEPTEPIGLDVLIVGGGITGLWLLNELHQRHYSAVLLERRELGGEQTNHSHVYLHRGYMYRSVSLAAGLTGVNTRWRDWLDERNPVYGAGPSYFGFWNSDNALEKVAFWDHPALRLPHDEAPLPLALRGGEVKVLYRSREICLDGHWLVSQLSLNVSRFIQRIDRINAIVRNPLRTVNTVHVTLPDGVIRTFLPKALVLTAGAGNQALLHQMSGGDPELLGALQGAQQIRLAHMLVVRGKRNTLAPLTGVFADLGGLFIVSRNLENEVVWLISDDRSPPVWFADDWTAHDTRRWLPNVLASLERLAPNYFGTDSLKSRLEWGVYAAPKAEGKAAGFLPSEVRTEQCGMDNVVAVWPSKLTLAPKATEDVLGLLQQPGFRLNTPLPFSVAWTNCGFGARVAPERWRRTPLLGWNDFCRCYT